MEFQNPSRIPIVSWRDVVKALKKKGFRIVREKKHIVMRNNNRIAVIPKHEEIAKGTLLAILRQAGISKHEFLELLRDP